MSELLSHHLQSPSRAPPTVLLPNPQTASRPCHAEHQQRGNMSKRLTLTFKEVSPLTLSVADVTRSFKRVNIRKAVGPDGIPGRVLKACAFQLAGVFTDIFNLSLSLSVVPSCFKKIHHCAHTKEKQNHMLEWLEARCSDPHLQQVFWEARQRLHLLCAACFTGPTTICIPQ